MPKISIIIPVYNVEKYLRQCLDSVVNQTLHDIEIICVNDGSTDGSAQILEEYRQRDERIKVIHKENEGVSIARNKGIEQATSEYITFCDSDDTFKSNLCEKVYEKINKDSPDVIYYGHDNYINDKYSDTDCVNIKKLKNNGFKYKDWLDLQVFIWEKTFKKTFLLQNNIAFPQNIKNAEDVVFCLECFLSNPKYSIIEDSLYNYSVERNGKSTFSNPNGIKNDFEAYKYLTRTKQYKEQNIARKRDLTDFFIRGSLWYYNKFKNTEFEPQILNDMKNYSDFVKTQFHFFNLLGMKNYQKIRKKVWKSTPHWYFNLFNIITKDEYKIFVFMGLKIKLRRNSYG